MSSRGPGGRRVDNPQELEAKAKARAGRTKAKAEAASDNGPPPEAVSLPPEARDPVTVFQPSMGVKVLEADDEIILADLLRDTYLRLNATGSAVWKMMVDGRSLGELTAWLATQSGISDEDALEVQIRFTNGLVERGVAFRGKQTAPQ